MLVSFASGCSILPFHTVEPQWKTSPVLIDISPIPLPPENGWSREMYMDCMEFSPDGKYLCVRFTHYKQPRPRIFVYDESGELVNDAVGKDGFLTDAYRELFPEISMRSSAYIMVNDPYNVYESTRNESKYAELTGFAHAWFFSKDYKYLVTISNPEMEKYVERKAAGKPTYMLYPDLKYVNVECWQLTDGKRRLWSSKLKVNQDSGATGIEVGEFFNKNGRDYIIFNYFLEPAYVFDAESGKLVDSFEYGPDLTEDDVDKIIQRYGLNREHWEDEIEFSPSEFAFNPLNRLLACGNFTSRHLRVISVDKPHKVVFEVFKYSSPQTPSNLFYGSSFWSSGELSFAGDKYLIVKNYAAARSLFRKRPYLRRVDIYNMKTWKRVWNMTALKGFYVILSDNGEKIAVTRGDFIEMGNFKDFQNRDPRVLDDDFL